MPSSSETTHSRNQAHQSVPSARVGQSHQLVQLELLVFESKKLTLGPFFRVPLNMSANALAKALNVPAQRINEIVRERRGVSAGTTMRLARHFGGAARSWLNLQAAYDLRVAEIENAKLIQREVQSA